MKPNMDANETLPITTPILSQRPLRLTVDRAITLLPAEVSRAWSERFDRRFVVPELVSMKAEVNVTWHFANDWCM